MIPTSTRVCAAIYLAALLAQHLPPLEYFRRPQPPPPRPRRSPRPVAEAERIDGFVFNGPQLRLSGWPLSDYTARIRAEGPLVHTQVQLTFDNISKTLTYGELVYALPQGAWVQDFSSEQKGVVSRPRVELAAAPLPTYEQESSQVDHAPPQVLQVRVPCAPGAGPVRIRFGYLQRFRSGEEYWLGMSRGFGTSKVVVETPTRTITPSMKPQGDLKLLRSGLTAELVGKRWGVRPTPPGLPVTLGVVPGAERCYWYPSTGPATARLVSPDPWNAWAQLPPEVWAGTTPPSPAQRQLILTHGILCPYSRYVFPGLEPGGLKPWKLVLPRAERTL